MTLRTCWAMVERMVSSSSELTIAWLTVSSAARRSFCSVSRSSRSWSDDEAASRCMGSEMGSGPSGSGDRSGRADTNPPGAGPRSYRPGPLGLQALGKRCLAGGFGLAGESAEGVQVADRLVGLAQPFPESRQVEVG